MKPVLLCVLKLLAKFTPCGIAAENCAPTVCSAACYTLYTMIIKAFYNLENMPQWSFKMIIALDRKGWDARGGATTEVAT